MSRRCELTAKGPQVGHKVSHSNIKTKRRFLPNLNEVSLTSDALSQTHRFRISASALRSVDHRLRRREIGLADLHVNDVAPGRFQRPCSRLHLHHVERLDVGDATGNEDPGVHRKSEWRSSAKAVS